MQIRLRQYSFSISAPYKAGHRATAEEATALNSARAEQIKANMRRAVEAACRDLPEDELLSDSQLARLQARVDLLDQAHQFRYQSPDDDNQLGALQVEALRVAEEKVETNSRKKGLPLPEGKELEVAVQFIAQQRDVLDEARLRLQQRYQEASRLLEELL